MEPKLCNVCNEDKPLHNYTFIKDRKKYKATCKECVARKSREDRSQKKQQNLRFCKNCKNWLDFSEFQKDQAERYHYECKKCVILLTKSGSTSKSVIVGSDKLCLECHKLINISNFPVGRGLGGVQAYCSSCIRLRAQKKYKSEKSKYRERSYRWRIENREVYLAQHRIHQFNRISQTKAQSDGTVDEDFLKQIYGTENCYYCNRATPDDERTLEHVIPLSRGGLHSVYNIEMACINCNSGKQHKTIEEWEEYKKI